MIDTSYIVPGKERAWARVATLSGAAIYVLSFFLPVVDVFEGTANGWAAFVFSFALIFDSSASVSSAWMLALGLSNLPLWYTAGRLLLAKRISLRLLGTMIVSTFLALSYGVGAAFQDGLDDVRIGYYVWATAFVLISAAAALDLRSGPASA